MKYIFTFLLVTQLILLSHAQNEIGIRVNVQYQSGQFAFDDDPEYEQIFQDLIKDVNIGYSFGVGYSYYITKNHGLEVNFSYNIHDFNFKSSGPPVNPDGGINVNFKGRTLRLVGGSFSYHFRIKPRNRSNITFDFGAGVGRYLSHQYQTKLDSPIDGFDPELPNMPNYTSLELIPSIIWNMGRNRQDKGIDLKLGTSNNFMFLEGANTNPRYVLGISVGVIFIF